MCWLLHQLLLAQCRLLPPLAYDEQPQADALALVPVTPLPEPTVLSHEPAQCGCQLQWLLHAHLPTHSAFSRKRLSSTFSGRSVIRGEAPVRA